MESPKQREEEVVPELDEPAAGTDGAVPEPDDAAAPEDAAAPKDPAADAEEIAKD